MIRKASDGVWMGGTDDLLGFLEFGFDLFQAGFLLLYRS